MIIKLNARQILMSASASLFCLSACATPPKPEEATTSVVQTPSYLNFADTTENRKNLELAIQEYEQVRKDHGKSITVNGIDMFYLEWGEPGGIPLIWSHGYSSRSFGLMQVGDDLAKAGFHVIALDSRGHGETKVSGYDFSLSHLADDIRAVMDELGMEKAVIGGLSLGGFISTTFYDHYPERTLALVLEDGGSYYVQGHLEKNYHLVKDLDLSYGPNSEKLFPSFFDAFKELIELFQMMWPEEIEASKYAMLASLIVETEEGKFKYRHDGLKLWGDGTKAAFNPAEAHVTPMLHQSWRRVHPLITFRNLHVPMIVIDPIGDHIHLSDQNEKLRQLHPELISVIEYPGAPHSAHQFRPEWLVRDLTNLLEQLEQQK